jgi:hypothetical protein
VTARIVHTCDGTRHGDPCRGARTARANLAQPLARGTAERDAARAGWRRQPDGTHLCPSPGHDAEPVPLDELADQPATYEPHPHLEHARRVLAERRANEGLS